MKYFFSLRIDANKDEAEKITSILGVKPNNIQVGWKYEIKTKDNEYVNFVEMFLSLLENKYDSLEQVGITREHISVWMIYAYEEQCNMEFNPVDLKRLGDNGITLCVSCYKDEL